MTLGTLLLHDENLGRQQTTGLPWGVLGILIKLFKEKKRGGPNKSLLYLIPKYRIRVQDRRQELRRPHAWSLRPTCLFP